MAPRLGIVRSQQSVPELPPGAGSTFESRIVGEDTAPGDTNVIVDGQTGVIRIENPDGSLEIKEAESEAGGGDDSDFDRNLALDMDEHDLASIASTLLQGIDSDIQSRAGWEDIRKKGMDMLGIKLEEAANSVSNTGNVSRSQATLILEAVMRSWANSRSELLPVGGPVKVRDDKPGSPIPGDPGEPDEPAQDEISEADDLGEQGDAGDGMPGIGHNGGPSLGGIVGGDMPMATPDISNQPGSQPAINRSLLADALELDMNHYLTVIDKEYYPETSRMLFSRALTGIEFKKVYTCPLRRRPVSVWVQGSNLIVSNDAVHLSGAGRVTEIIQMRQSTMRRLQAKGHYRETDLVVAPQTTTSIEEKKAEIEGVTRTRELTEDYPYEVCETYVELDHGILAKDETGEEPGYPLPYRVSIERHSQKVLEIRRNWKDGDEDHQARRRYVKFGFVPGLGFYDYGFAHILGNPQRTATAIQRILIDAGMFKSFPGGVIAKGPGTRGKTVLQSAPGEFAVLDTGGLPIGQVAMPWPYGEPSQVLMAVLQKVENDARRLSGILELPMGEGRVGDVPATTIMSYIDSISKVPSAVHKDDHMAQQEEFELLRELFIEDPDSLTKGARRPNRKWTAVELEDQDLVPAADPNVPSQMHRISQVRTAIEMSSLPQFNGIADMQALWEWGVRTLGVLDVSSVTKKQEAQAQAAPPDPKAIAAQAKLQTEQMKGALKLQEIQANAAARQQELAVENANREADRASAERVAQTRVQESTIRQQGERIKMASKAMADQEANAAKVQTEAMKQTAATQATAGQIMADHVKHQNEMAMRGAELAQADRHHQDNHEVALTAAEAKLKASAAPSKPKNPKK